MGDYCLKQVDTEVTISGGGRLYPNDISFQLELSDFEEEYDVNNKNLMLFVEIPYLFVQSEDMGRINFSSNVERSVCGVLKKKNEKFFPFTCIISDVNPSGIVTFHIKNLIIRENAEGLKDKSNDFEINIGFKYSNCAKEESGPISYSLVSWRKVPVKILNFSSDKGCVLRNEPFCLKWDFQGLAKAKILNYSNEYLKEPVGEATLSIDKTTEFTLQLYDEKGNPLNENRTTFVQILYPFLKEFKLQGVGTDKAKLKYEIYGAEEINEVKDANNKKVIDNDKVILEKGNLLQRASSGADFITSTLYNGKHVNEFDFLRKTISYIEGCCFLKVDWKMNINMVVDRKSDDDEIIMILSWKVKDEKEVIRVIRDEDIYQEHSWEVILDDCSSDITLYNNPLDSIQVILDMYPEGKDAYSITI